MEDIKIRLAALEMKIDRIMRDNSNSNNVNPYGFLSLPPRTPDNPPPERKRPKRTGRKKRTKKKKQSKTNQKGGDKYTWKVGDCVRPIGMPTYYIIKGNHNKDNWLMAAPSGGNHEITDIIPKSMETSGTWEKVKCDTGNKSKRKSKKKKSLNK